MVLKIIPADNRKTVDWIYNISHNAQNTMLWYLFASTVRQTSNVYNTVLFQFCNWW